MIYFASDIHLGAGDPATARCTERRFTAWLDAVSRDAEAIYLLGDLFDFWFEYRRVVPQGFVRTLGKLAELTDRGVRVVFFTGNHDMWVGDYLHRECGVEIHTEPQVVTLAGKRLFLAHGDNINVGHLPWLCFMNRVFRSRPETCRHCAGTTGTTAARRPHRTGTARGRAAAPCRRPRRHSTPRR